MELGQIEELKRQKRFAKIDEIDPDFRGTAQSWNKDEIDDRLAEIAKLEQLTQDQKRADPEVSSLKEQTKNATASYRETTKACKLKSEFLVWVLEQKGKL